MYVGTVNKWRIISLLSLTNYTHTHTAILHPSELCLGLPGWVSTRTNLDSTEARDSEWQWHQLGHMQICTLPQTYNHASTSSLSFWQPGCPSCHQQHQSTEGLSLTIQLILCAEFLACFLCHHEIHLSDIAWMHCVPPVFFVCKALFLCKNLDIITIGIMLL